jgi:hypothetical protein
MNILWLNWRDIKNPEAGGAEIEVSNVLLFRIKKKDIKIL